MRLYALPVFFLSIAFLLSSCSREGLLVVTDQYWDQGVLAGEGVKSRIMDAGRRAGLSVRVAVVPHAANTGSKLAAELRGSSAQIVVLSPLYSADADHLAREFPNKRIVAFESGSSTPRPENLVLLISDPGTVFRKAGERAAKQLDSLAGGSVQVAAVFPHGGAGDKALDAFSAGLESGSVHYPLSTIRVGGAVDETALRRFIEDSRAKNTGLYLLAAPQLNGYAVQLLKDSKAPIVTEDWIYGSTYSDKVLFSINKDIPSALMKVVETMGRPADNEIRIPWDLVAAPTNS